MKNILVVGGAGYIGSVVTKDLCELNKYNVFVIDNLSKGQKKLVDKRAKFTKLDILNYKKLNKYLNKNKIDVIMHFAGAKDAGESMTNPNPYSDNIIGSLNILKAMEENKINKIIFSSSAAVYGIPKESKKINENNPTNPINYYGFSKLETEKAIIWYHKLKGIDYVILRYFNVAGDGGLNYVDPNPSNIFPIIGEVVSGKREHINIFGKDYNTKDGTCIRDYIHISDLSLAHIKALKLNTSEIINLGTSKGFTVLELVKEFKKVSKKKLRYKFIERRKGDPEILLTSNKKAKEILNWEPKLSLYEMVKSTIDVYNKNNN